MPKPTEEELDAFWDALQKSFRREAVREQKHRSVGTRRQCCKTCNWGIHDEKYKYVSCQTHGENRTPGSVCLDWAKKGKVKK